MKECNEKERGVITGFHIISKTGSFHIRVRKSLQLTDILIK